MHSELVLTYEGEFIAGGFGKHGKLSWPDGSTYEGDVLHKDWIYLSSRVTGQVYRVSAVLTMAQPHFERVRVPSLLILDYGFSNSMRSCPLVRLLRA